MSGTAKPSDDQLTGDPSEVSNRTLWTGCQIATMAAGSESDYGLIRDAAMVTVGEHIEWVGDRSELSASVAASCGQQVEFDGALITPGLIDCHTHLVYGGDRAAEFEMRLNGASYEEIANAGGGIASTVKATRELSAEKLEAQSWPRLRQMLEQGVTTVEIKSGYGLSLEQERKCLSVARALGRRAGICVRTSFLGAHAVPPEFKGQSDAYVDEVLRMLPLLHGEGLVDAVDVFCERIGFSLAQTRARSAPG